MNPSVRAGLNWLWLATPFGLLVARLGGCRLTRGPRQLWLADGYRPGFPLAQAFTVGNVLIFRHDIEEVAGHCPGLLRHEERHSTQWAGFGPFFLPMYLLAMCYSWLRTGDRGLANWFEMDADLVDGGYQTRPTNPDHQPRPLNPTTKPDH